MTPDWRGKMMACDRCAKLERRRRSDSLLMWAWFVVALPIWAMAMKAVLGW